jgi:hypothetical protein
LNINIKLWLRVFSATFSAIFWSMNHKSAEKKLEIVVDEPLKVTVEKVVEKERVDKVEVKEPRCGKARQDQAPENESLKKDC